MFLKVRVADLVEARTPVKSASIKDETLKVETTTESCTSKKQSGVGQSSHDSELSNLEDIEGRGVFYCEIDSKNHIGAHLDNIDWTDSVTLSYNWGTSSACLACRIKPIEWYSGQNVSSFYL